MVKNNLFDDIASIGEKFLKSTDRGQKMLSDYTWQLASICDLIKHTHSIVINKLEAIDKADNLEEAKAIVQELSGGSLSASFRASGLCDVFQGYGKSLRRITEKYQKTAEPVNALPIDGFEQRQWNMFCMILEERELEVATLYANEIQGLQDLNFKYSGRDLKQIKKYATQAKMILTDQVANFDSLAARFRKQIKV